MATTEVSIHTHLDNELGIMLQYLEKVDCYTLKITDKGGGRTLVTIFLSREGAVGLLEKFEGELRALTDPEG